MPLPPPHPHFNSSHNNYPSLTRGVSHCGLAKTYLKAKEEIIMETQIFHSNISYAKIYPIFKKNPLKEAKILQDILL